MLKVIQEYICSSHKYCSYLLSYFSQTFFVFLFIYSCKVHKLIQCIIVISTLSLPTPPQDPQPHFLPYFMPSLYNYLYVQFCNPLSSVTTAHLDMENGFIYQSMENLPVATPLKKMDSSSPQYPSIANSSSARYRSL